VLEEPELVELLPEEEEEPPPTPPTDLGRRLAIQIVTVVVLKVATGLAIKSLTKTIREFDVLYPEHFERIRWKEQP
jgi:hypothetical protein